MIDFRNSLREMSDAYAVASQAKADRAIKAGKMKNIHRAR